MIDFYSYPTPNGRKVAIALAELDLPHTLHRIDIGKGDQFAPSFVALNPNSKIPVIVDRDTNTTVFESGAILIYLAEKTGLLLPSDAQARLDVIQWLMFQMASVGPMFGQLNHFKKFAPEVIPYAIQRYTKETERLYAVLDKRLADREYVCDRYSIADIAIYPWIAIHEWQGLSIALFPNLQRWCNTLAARPAVIAGMERA